MEKFNIQNIIDGQALGISITGMSIVFFGLLFISLYIAVLPKILDYLMNFGKKGKETSLPAVSVKKQQSSEETEAAAIKESESYDIASVIGLVLQMEHERLVTAENEQITITRDIHQSSMWGSSGKMRKMPQRRTHA